MILWLAFVFAKKVNKSLNTTTHCNLTLGSAQFMVWIACEYSRLSLLIAATDVEEPGQMAVFSCYGLKCEFKRNLCIINYLYSSNVHNAFSKYNNYTALFVLNNKKVPQNSLYFCARSRRPHARLEKLILRGKKLFCRLLKNRTCYQE